MTAVCAAGFAAISVIKSETPTPPTTPRPISGNSKRHQCRRCNATFVFANKLRLHVARRHSGAHRCGKDGCEAKFDSHIQLRAHHKSHHPIRHACTECSFVTDRPAHLKKHVQTCHINGIVCPIPNCGKRMEQRRLKSHLATEHGGGATRIADNDENLPFKCERCLKRFRTRRYCAKHVARAHSGKQPEKTTRERKFICPRADCAKSFVSSLALDDHINTHDGVAAWPCKLCERRFSARARLAVHLRKVHLTSIQQIDPWQTSQ